MGEQIQMIEQQSLRSNSLPLSPQPSRLQGLRALFKGWSRQHTDVLSVTAVGVAFVLIFANAGSANYTYDAKGRVQEIVYVGSQTITKRSYQYDEFGNKTTTLSRAPALRDLQLTTSQTSLAGPEISRRRAL